MNLLITATSNYNFVLYIRVNSRGRSARAVLYWCHNNISQSVRICKSLVVVQTKIFYWIFAFDIHHRWIDREKCIKIHKLARATSMLAGRTTTKKINIRSRRAKEETENCTKQTCQHILLSETVNFFSDWLTFQMRTEQISMHYHQQYTSSIMTPNRHSIVLEKARKLSVLSLFSPMIITFDLIKFVCRHFSVTVVNNHHDHHWLSFSLALLFVYWIFRSSLTAVFDLFQFFSVFFSVFFILFSLCIAFLLFSILTATERLVL